MSDINYPSRPLNSATDSVTVSGAVTTSTPSVGATGAAVPASADYVGVNVGGTLTGLTGSGSGLYVEVNAALPAGSNTIGAVSQNGQWDITDITGTVSLPTGAATAAKQPALGIAGTASSDVITVQGISGMTALKVDGSAVTQPVSGTITASQSGTWDINNVSGTVSLPTGAATAAKQPALGTAGTASADVITVQGIASMTALKVDGSAVTQPVSVAGRSKVLLYRNDYSSVNVTTSAYVQVVASTAAAINRLYIADTSGSAMILAVGGAGAEVDQLYIGPGGSDAPYELNIPASSRIAIKALDVSATSGQMVLTALS